ncbi:MAG: ABC transporter permease [Gemmatimonadales bacterium]
MRRLVRRPAFMAGLLILMVVVGAALLADVIAPGDPLHTTRDGLLTPRRGHILGTDNLGRDTFTGVVHGARTSMTVVGWVASVSTVIGLTVGLAAGYRGGRTDDLLMRVTELFQSVPRFFLALFWLGIAGPSLTNLIVVLAFTSWTLLARIVRAETKSAQAREFVDAARAMGASAPGIVVRHIFPAVLPVAMVIIAMTASRVILLESSLAFLGLTDQSRISWGTMVSNAQPLLGSYWLLSLIPGTAIALTIVGINLVADSLAGSGERTYTEPVA